MSVWKTSSAKLIQVKEKDALFADFRSALMLECGWKVKWAFFSESNCVMLADCKWKQLN